MDNQNILTWLFSENGRVAVAGAAGGIVRWLTVGGNWKEGLVNLVVGTICAVYIGPLAGPVMEPVLGQIITDEIARATLNGFVIGIGGLSVSGFLIDLWRGWKKAQVPPPSPPPSPPENPDAGS